MVHESSPHALQAACCLELCCDSESLIESTLFGHVGSFTGANNASEGYFEKANGGTLFLDEIADAHASPIKITPVLQENEVHRSLDDCDPLDVRVVSATNIDIKQAIHQKVFERTLFSIERIQT